MSPLEVVLIGNKTTRSGSKAIINKSLIANDRPASIELQELRVLDHNLAPHVVQLDKTVKVVRGLVEDHIL